MGTRESNLTAGMRDDDGNGAHRVIPGNDSSPLLIIIYSAFVLAGLSTHISEAPISASAERQASPQVPQYVLLAPQSSHSNSL